jgi:hypothetical protein
MLQSLKKSKQHFSLQKCPFFSSVKHNKNHVTNKQIPKAAKKRTPPSDAAHGITAVTFVVPPF